MISPHNRQAELRRMEDACRQARHQLAMIERQISARMTSLIPQLGRRRTGYRRGRPREAKAFLARYRSNLAAITAERQPEIDALSRKLARQEAAAQHCEPTRLYPAAVIETNCRWAESIGDPDCGAGRADRRDPFAYLYEYLSGFGIRISRLAALSFGFVAV